MNISDDYRRSVVIKSFVPLIHERHEAYQGVISIIIVVAIVLYYRKYISLRDYIIATCVIILLYIIEESWIQHEYAQLEKIIGHYNRPLSRTRYLINIIITILILSAAFSFAKSRKGNLSN